MRINHFKYILKTAELGSITRAAQELYISQPSLTKVISNAEKEYNITIFERTPVGVNVTLQGKEFLHYAKNIAHHSLALEEMFKDNSNKKRAQLLVVAQTLDFMPKVFLNMYNKYKDYDMEFEYFQTYRTNVITAIRNGQYNIGMLVLTERDSKAFKMQIGINSNIEVGVLDSDNPFVLVGPHSSLYNAQTLTFESVREVSHICLDIDKAAREGWEVDNKRIHIDTNSVVYCNTIPVCIELLEKTDMILCASKWILDYFKNTNIRAIPIVKDSLPPSKLVWIKRKNELLTPVEADFVEMMQKTLVYNDND